MAVDLYCVPVAAAVVGWILCDYLLLEVRQTVAENALAPVTPMSMPLAYGARLVCAVLCWTLASRYLN
jgi:hypothetical protein